MPRKTKSSKQRTRGGRSRTRSGGFWDVIRNAVVPFTILAAQQTFSRKKSHGGRTRKRR